MRQSAREQRLDPLFTCFPGFGKPFVPFMVSFSMKLFRRPAPALGALRSQPVETGTVQWMRELNDALAASAETGRPVFALFQEVPGCAGCKQFGKEVLSDPFVVEVIEREFIPLLIHNNTGGRDAEVLRAYGEPAWNYQVVRFLDAGGDDIIDRRDRVWETGPLLARMVATLEVAGREIPDYLRLLEQQHSEYLGEAFLAQPCFWVGEMEIGQIDGVVVTEAGFMHGHEVTRVLYDQRVLNLETLYEKAARRNVASAVFADSDELRRLGGRAKVDKPGRYRKAPPSDQKRQLGRGATGNYTDSQLTKLNAFTRTRRGDTDRFLLPSQR